MLNTALKFTSISQSLPKTASSRQRVPSRVHCTTKDRGSRQRARTRIAAVLLGAVLVLGLVLSAADDTFARNTWRAVFDLQPGITYTYTLTYEQSGRGPASPPWVWFGPDGPEGGAGRSRFATITGELNLYRSGGADDTIRFWFTIDGVRVNGTAPNDPQAVAGAVLVAALTNTEPLSPEAVRLLTTVFHWTNWRDLFERSAFRNGTVWNVVQHPPHQFTARRQGFGDVYRGEITRGRDTVLEITIDLAKPLPLEIVAWDGRDRYVAALAVQEPVRGPRR